MHRTNLHLRVVIDRELKVFHGTGTKDSTTTRGNGSRAQYQYSSLLDKSGLMATTFPSPRRVWLLDLPSLAAP
jgi:hypothetical protein